MNGLSALTGGRELVLFRPLVISPSLQALESTIGRYMDEECAPLPPGIKSQSIDDVEGSSVTPGIEKLENTRIENALISFRDLLRS